MEIGCENVNFSRVIRKMRLYPPCSEEEVRPETSRREEGGFAKACPGEEAGTVGRSIDCGKESASRTPKL